MLFIPTEFARFDDMIGVGGTAGLALARLHATDATLSIAVVEAGGLMNLAMATRAKFLLVQAPLWDPSPPRKILH